MIGLELSRRFFASVVEPLLSELAPGLAYGAARLGNGSEVLGYDTEMSGDHNYGPSVQIVLSIADFERAPALLAVLDTRLPEKFEGWTVRFPSFGRPVGMPGWLSSGHDVILVTLEALVDTQLGIGLAPLEPFDWLALPEQRLLTVTAGAVFRDDHGTLRKLRDTLAWLPRDVWLLKLAAQWDRVGEERAFVGRTGLLGDDIGSRLVASRLVYNLMRIAFLIEQRYAPYAKWFGTAFARLSCAPQLAPHLDAALAAADWQTREAAIASAAELLARLQLDRDIPGALAPRVDNYFTRPFRVINADEIASGLRQAISDPALRNVPAGAIDQFVESTPILSSPALSRGIMAAARRSDDGAA